MKNPILGFLYDKKIPQHIFADLIGVTPVMVSSILSGKTSVTIKTLLKIHKATEIDLLALAKYFEAIELKRAKNKTNND